MNEFNEDALFSPIRTKIENGELKTANNLRIILDGLAERFDISTLKILQIFRAWLLNHNLDLQTTYGAVTVTKVADGL